MKKHILIVSIVSLALISCGRAPEAEPNLDELEWIDLSHTFGPETLYWPTAEKFDLKTVAEGQTEGGYYYSAYQFSTSEHGGTHLDAPVHFHEDGAQAHEIELDRLIGLAIVIDVSDKTTGDPDYLITSADIREWEDAHGPITGDPIVLFNTGWAKHWPDAKAYLGTSQRGPDAVPDLHFPGISAEAATFLVEERGIRAVGIDTASLDFGQSSDFAAHQVFGAGNIAGFENITNLNELPPRGSTVVALPMKILGGSGGPLRIVAGVER